MFNRPWLDLVVHVLINQLLPHMWLTLANMLGTHCIGHAILPNDWQSDFCALWLNMSKSDEQRNIECQLEVLRSSKKMKGHTECLAELEAKAKCLNSTYHIDVNRWTCSCPLYLISQFLLCKHLICTTNTQIEGFDPKDDLAFFASLQQNHFPPFYHIPTLYHIQHSNSAPVVREKPVQKVLRTLEAIADELDIRGVDGDGAKQRKAEQPEGIAKGGMKDVVVEEKDVDGRNKNQQTPLEPQEDAKHVNLKHYGSSVLTESKDTDNEHQVFRSCYLSDYSSHHLIELLHRS